MKTAKVLCCMFLLVILEVDPAQNLANTKGGGLCVLRELSNRPQFLCFSG